jgi:hypothetical protein
MPQATLPPVAVGEFKSVDDINAHKAAAHKVEVANIFIGFGNALDNKEVQEA